MSTQPLITIITPCLNRVSMIAEALESVQRQNYSPFEHIIVDGGSTDGTLKKLAEYPHLKVVSEPDRGTYYALNKGLELAQGEFIGFLNTDDFYTEGIFTGLIGLLEETQVAAVAGQAVLFLRGEDHTNRIFRRSKLMTPEALWRELTFGDTALNAWFFHRRVFDRIGGFDTSYRIVSDRDFLLRLGLSDLSHTFFEKVVYWYRAHPESMTFSRNLQHFSEIADENLRLVDQYLDRIPASSRADLERVRTRDTIIAASRNLRTGANQRALHYMQIGWRYDLLWPLKFLIQIFTGIFRVMGRKIGLYPPI